MQLSEVKSPPVCARDATQNLRCCANRHVLWRTRVAPRRASLVLRVRVRVGRGERGR